VIQGLIVPMVMNIWIAWAVSFVQICAKTVLSLLGMVWLATSSVLPTHGPQRNTLELLTADAGATMALNPLTMSAFQ